MNAQELREGPIVVTAYDWVPDFARGYVRDLRVRWALEEAGLPYETDLVRQGEQRRPPNLARQPFGQVPAMTAGGRTMFETGACLWRIAEASDALLPTDDAGRDACLSWLFGALDSVEGPIEMLVMLRLFAKDKEAAQRLEPEMAAFARERLGRLADALGESAYLVGGRFTVADLMMTTVLRDAGPAELEPFPTLPAYVARHMARPAFRRAMDAQLAPFEQNAARYEANGAAKSPPGELHQEGDAP